MKKFIIKVNNKGEVSTEIDNLNRPEVIGLLEMVKEQFLRPTIEQNIEAILRNDDFKSWYDEQLNKQKTEKQGGRG